MRRTVKDVMTREVVCAREDRLLLQHIGADYRERMGSSARWIPGVF